MLYLLRDLRSNATESSGADHNNMNMTSELPPAIEQTIGHNTEDVGIDPEVPISLCYSSDLALERGLQVENGEAIVTAGGLIISAGDLEDRCEPVSIRIRLPACHFSNSAQLIFKPIPRRKDGPAADNWLETTSMTGNLWDHCGKPIVCLPVRQIENQPLGQVHMMDNDHLATESIERPAKRTSETMGIPDAHLVMQGGQIWLDSDRYRVLMRAAATEKNMATVEQTLPFVRTSSEWDPSWKLEGEYTGHGRATAGGVLKHQGNGEEPGIEKGEELGDEKGEAQKLQVTKEREEGMLGEETSGAKIAGEGGKVGNPEAEGATRRSLHDNPDNTGKYREWDPGQGAAMRDDFCDPTAGGETVPGCHIRSQLDTEMRKRESLHCEHNDIFPLFAWPPPNRGILERYFPSEQSLARLNQELERRYFSSVKESDRAKESRKASTK